MTGRRRLSVSAEGPLRIGFSRDLAPLAALRRGRPHGVIVDLVTEALRRAKIAAQFLPCDDSSLLQQLERRAIDAAVPVAVTRERRRRFRFSEALVYTAAGWFVRRGAPPVVRTLLADSRIATPAHGPLATLVRRKFPQLVVIPTPDYITALDYVARGVVAAAALNLDVGRALAQQFPSISSPETGFYRLPLALAFRRIHAAALVRAVNVAIRGMKT